MNMRFPAFSFAGLLVLALFLFGANIGGYDLWPADEPRFAQVAREMLDSENYLAPHVNGEPYREKPPLLFWLIAAVSGPLGDVTAFSARVPSLFAALLTVLCTALIAYRLFDRWTALWAAVVLATSLRFWWEARTAQTDMVLTAALTLALLFFCIWRDNRRPIFLAFFYLAIAAGVYAKGPPAIVFPLLFIFTYFWKQKDERRKTHWFLGTVFVVLLAMLWLVPARMSLPGTEEATQAAISADLFRHTIGRLFLGVSHAQPPWYYLINLPIDLLPWTFLLPFTIVHAWKRRSVNPSTRLMLAWILPALVFFSVSIGKRALYLLPIFPPLAILIANSLVTFTAGKYSLWRRRTAFIWGVIILAVALAPLGIRYTDYASAWNPNLLIFTAAASTFAVHALATAVFTGARLLPQAIATHMAALQIIAAFLIFPAINPYKSARAFCKPLAALQQQGDSYALYSIAFSREEYVFYARHFHEPLLTDVLPLEAPEGVETADSGELQRRLRKALSKATRTVPVVSFAELKDEERVALADVVEQTLREHEIPRTLSDAFAIAVKNELSALSGQEKPGPIFAFVQEEDLRWLLPLVPALAELEIVRQANVGSRHVLLLANGPAQGLYRRVLPMKRLQAPPPPARLAQTPQAPQEAGV